MNTRAICTAAAAVMLAACGGEPPTGTDIDGANAQSGGRGAGTGSTSTGSTTTGSPSGATTAARCNGTLGATTVTLVFVPNGASCTLNGTRVQGNVIVATNASLAASNARIDGNIQGDDALRMAATDGTVILGDVQAKRRASVVMTNTVIGGNLQIEEAGASLVTENR
jgi:hypothetical protein